MDFGAVFERYELKYRLNAEQMAAFRKDLDEYMHLDKYGLTTIQSVYYDTDTDLLIRTSMEKPVFKEKIRLRSYGLAKENGRVFLELKRKCEGLVYKRRIATTEAEAEAFFERKGGIGQGQIDREITYFRDLYKTLSPAMVILYDRLAYFQDGTDVRVTFDCNPRYRTTDLNLHTSLEGIPLLPEGDAIMEIKILDGMPLWLIRLMKKHGVKRYSFSKYGEAYAQTHPRKERKTTLWKTSSTPSLAVQ